MPEPRNDMLPDTEPVVEPAVPSVTGPTPTPVPAVPAAPVPPAAPTPTPSPAPSGAQTPPENLKAALDEERRLRKEEREKRETAEARVAELEAVGAPSNTIDDADLTPGEKLLKKQIDGLEKDLRKSKRDRETDLVISQYPALQDKRAEFETFCDGYPPNTGREKLAKIFLAEKGLLDNPPARPGLERPSAGPRESTPQAKFSREEIDRMMKSEPRRFNKLISQGVIRPEDLEG